MLGRGIARHCPRCAARPVFVSWFRMVERCPGCGLQFERENDFFLGAYMVNLGVTEGLLLVGLFVYIFAAVDNPDLPVAPVVVIAIVLAVAGPLVFFPFSRTIWSAIDLAMRPQPLEGAPDDEGAPPSYEAPRHRSDGDPGPAP